MVLDGQRQPRGGGATGHPTARLDEPFDEHRGRLRAPGRRASQGDAHERVTESRRGILAAARLATAQASAGTVFELTVVAAVIIGGTSMIGGSATVIGTVIGSLLLAVLLNGMTIIGLSPYYQNLLVGVVIVFAVALDQWRRSRPA